MRSGGGGIREPLPDLGGEPATVAGTELMGLMEVAESRPGKGVVVAVVAVVWLLPLPLPPLTACPCPLSPPPACASARSRAVWLTMQMMTMEKDTRWKKTVALPSRIM